MPLLAREINVFPNDLLEQASAPTSDSLRWWTLYSLSRQEKQLMRRLHMLEIPFYSPIIAHRYRSSAGRIRISYLPLFSNYVFMFGDEGQRQAALTTRCVSRWVAVPPQARLTEDLRQIQRLIETGAPLTAEQRLEPGATVRVRSGPFQGFEGVVIRREKETRLLVAVNFLQQGASVVLEDCQLERLT